MKKIFLVGAVMLTAIPFATSAAGKFKAGTYVWKNGNKCGVLVIGNGNTHKYGYGSCNKVETTMTAKVLPNGNIKIGEALFEPQTHGTTISGPFHYNRKVTTAKFKRQ